MAFRKESVIVADIGTYMVMLERMAELTHTSKSYCLRMLLRKAFAAARTDPAIETDPFIVPEEVLK